MLTSELNVFLKKTSVWFKVLVLMSVGGSREMESRYTGRRNKRSTNKPHRSHGETALTFYVTNVRDGSGSGSVWIGLFIEKKEKAFFFFLPYYTQSAFCKVCRNTAVLF